MSHRPEDHYEYVAVNDIMSGTVRAFSPGDPVPADTVEALGLLDSGDVVHRDDYERPDGEETPARPMKRGDMPPHLQSSAVPASADTGSSRTKTKATAAGKASE
jgi:hypothetical protein